MNKIKSKRGFTLTEVLMVAVIVSLLGVAITVGISTAVRVYEGITTKSDATVLCSSLMTEISDEIRSAKTITEDDDGEIILNSERFGANASYSVRDGRVYLGEALILPENHYGSLAVGALTLAAVDEYIEIDLVVTFNGETRAAATISIQPLISEIS